MQNELDKSLGYNPDSLPRELTKYYISASKQDISEMLKTLNLKSLEDIYSDINDNCRLDNFSTETYLDYSDNLKLQEDIANENKPKTSFLGNTLAQYKIPELVAKVCGIRGLTTAYTPYQPERSQGTLMTLWLYQSLLAQLTGFEAINASMYDRSTCLFEAINCAKRLQKKSNKILILDTIYQEDLEVVQTLGKETDLKIIIFKCDLKNGVANTKEIETLLQNEDHGFCGIVFSQINRFGLLEDVHTLTNLSHQYKLQSIAIIDPMTIASEGLIPPSQFGENGAHMIVGEGQHLALAANYGGPGLGIFGIRFNDKNKNAIRSTAGRYVGDAFDEDNNPCKLLVLSTREQHIKKDKATSNICSNQSFIATMAGAGILARGEKGMKQACLTSKNNALKAFEFLTSLEGITSAFSNPFYNEFILELDIDLNKLIDLGREANLQIGINLSNDLPHLKSALKLSFTDLQSDLDLDKLLNFFSKHFSSKEKSCLVQIPKNLLRQGQVGLPNMNKDDILKYYIQLGQQNVSPDDNLYPLGSCTMKYNPYINDYAAGLRGFQDIHPESHPDDAQGCLKIIYKLQELFKDITGLSAVTTQPMAGAQGELVGIKMFQAYHRNNNDTNRDILIIPKSSHGTNFATATMAGFTPKKNGVKSGIQYLEASQAGVIDLNHLQEIINEYGPRICGIMVTNPNTCGIMENQFKTMAEMIHNTGGLVYMDGANMNAIAGWVDLSKLGVDAVHNNLHKTWSIPHGGGGPGDAIVAVSDKLVDYLPGSQITHENSKYIINKPSKSIGSVHRHFGNFAHKVRCYTYLRALGAEGIKKMSAVAVLSARYLLHKLKDTYPILPSNQDLPRMHEFILTLQPELFDKIEKAGTKKALAISRVGKLFLDFGLHAPTIAWPETYGLMVEPTESFSKAELDRFIEVVKEIHNLISTCPEVLATVPHFTPVRRIKDVEANKNLKLSETITEFTPVLANKVSPEILAKLSVKEISKKILEAHKACK
ncbi:MAG: glycine dehydrogenase [Candidatus Cloacimonadota bacterium]|nr:MAG: glycine dehydrogenase [Candidatus Cloacimonadota bacterium]